MLVLSRKTGESVMIGDDIEITLVSTEGSKVRIGIQAPPEVPVHRKEIYLEILASAQDPRELEGPDFYRAFKRRAS
ncbi:MAG TPA: carbon storage regulator CsrA [Solirubrobacteraceae bacterium]|nr:carbon storage regulator CsrA [Solirubrobacteraceae bacterium]